MEDPFKVVKDEVQHSLTVVHELHKRWKEILKSATGKESEEYEWTTSELLSGLRSIEWDLQDLEETIRIVQGNRVKFGLTDEEVESRKHFVESTHESIASMRAEVSSTEPVEPAASKAGAGTKKAAKKAGTERESLLASDSAAAGASSVGITIDKAAHTDNSRLINDERQKQQQVMREQDTQLDAISTSVSRLKHIGVEINSELKVQDKLLEEIGEQTDSATAQMRNSMKALVKLAKDSDNGKLCVMFVLTLILIGLCYAIFS
ncbi:syntaxin 6, N-terminal-domain-containing protein [Pavlovales sp. CCMP2436]|nr:syntaxin 6, N-terminal-domain-containing protein [Pavlovales sp. CCMP2436]|mmetsp:Transcript_5065/g.13133  ORF Transcript_5065/g.13133 Transcript_5065/m.13133 type:complete len:263 (+) Transcript_5065:127-915(+)